MIQSFNDSILIFKAIGDIYGNLFNAVKESVNWDRSFKSRKTASFGIPYNYSNINYKYLDFPFYIERVIDDLSPKLGYRPNNCLINFYDNSSSFMGFHSDRTDILVQSTGITILSLGNQRTMRFKNKFTGAINDELMEPKSFMHMTAELQNEWLHAVLPIDNSEVDNERISITFRKLTC
ncbi:alpha-ketoglutarate-dependent dioxygenase AlkB [Mucilaginibacter terrae]|uniref:alpha-ketoglutarate-dependent dioxygenase AlkB n=1 Tax=Mucilaginibacter terrae TaxID=1955052 RepID=UPI00362F179D